MAFDLAKLRWTVTADLSEAADPWLRFEQSAVVTPFQRFAWVKAWHEVYGAPAGAKVAIVCAHSGDRLLALFPLAIERLWGARCLTWVARRWNDYNAPLLDPEFLASLSDDDIGGIWRQLADCAGGADLCLVGNQPSEIGGRRNPFAHFSAAPEASSAHSLALGSDWPSFEAHLFSRATLRRLRDKGRSLAKDGPVDVRRIDDPGEQASVVATLLDWKSAQLAARGSLNPFEDERASRFLQTLVRAGGDTSEVHAIFLAGAPVAAILALRVPDGLLIYQMAYDLGPVSRRSPGRLLLRHLIMEMVQDGRRRLDFSTGDEDYKVELCDRHLLLTQTAQGFTPAGTILAAALRAKLALKRAIKARPGLLALLEATHRRLKQVRPRPAPRLAPGHIDPVKAAAE